jgi:hypothetical protein
MQRERRRHATEGIGGLATDWSTRLRDLHAFDVLWILNILFYLSEDISIHGKERGAKGYMVSRFGLLARYLLFAFIQFFLIRDHRLSIDSVDHCFGDMRHQKNQDNEL